MPEMTFRVRWPDGTESECYSPSLVIRDYFIPGQDYLVRDFLEKAERALTQASDRVRARYGFACGRALGQIQILQQTCTAFLNQPDAQVRVLSFSP